MYIGVNRSGTIDVVGNRYIDRLERRNGEWRIFRHVCVVDWFGAFQDESHFDPLLRGAMDELLANAHTARDRTDISYVRPLEITRTPRSPQNSSSRLTIFLNTKVQRMASGPFTLPGGAGGRGGFAHT